MVVVNQVPIILLLGSRRMEKGNQKGQGRVEPMPKRAKCVFLYAHLYDIWNKYFSVRKS